MTIPILPSSDFDATSDFYRVLGFTEIRRWSGEYLILSHPVGIELHFWDRPGLDPVVNDASCYIRFDSEDMARALAERWGRVAPEHVRPPQPTDYGLVEFVVLDTDRNLLRLGGFVNG